MGNTQEQAYRAEGMWPVVAGGYHNSKSVSKIIMSLMASNFSATPVSRSPPKNRTACLPGSWVHACHLRGKLEQFMGVDQVMVSAWTQGVSRGNTHTHAHILTEV